MSQSLTLELSDQVFVAIEQQAQLTGISPSQLITMLLERQFSSAFKLPWVEAEKNTERSIFEYHFGKLKLQYPTNLDNESIDIDLAQEYANSHDGE